MSDERARWNAYLWEPGGYVLRNKWGIRGALEFAQAEYHETYKRSREIARGKVEIPRTYDGAHLRAIHAHLFGNIYEWAGEYRTVGMQKGASPESAFAPPDHIGRYVGYARRVIEETDWASLEPEAFAAASARVFAYINHAHPFREGNGRTARIFMEHVAERSPNRFRFERIDPETWNMASRLSSPANPFGEPDPRPVESVFRKAAQELSARPTKAFGLDAETLRALWARGRGR